MENKRQGQHQDTDAEAEQGREFGCKRDGFLSDVSTKCPPHGMSHDGSVIGNCSSNECAIRGTCSYPTACRKLRVGYAKLEHFIRAGREQLMAPATVGEAAAMASEILDLRNELAPLRSILSTPGTEDFMMRPGIVPPAEVTP